MVQILIDFLVKLLERLVPIALRRRFPPERLASQIKVRVAAEGEGIEYWNGELPQIRVVIRVTNLSPFPLEIERAYGTFSYGSQIGEFTYLHREQIPAAFEKDLILKADITRDQAEYIQKMIPNRPRASIEFNANIQGRLHNLQLSRTLETTHYRMVNFEGTA